MKGRFALTLPLAALLPGLAQAAAMLPADPPLPSPRPPISKGAVLERAYAGDRIAAPPAAVRAADMLAKGKLSGLRSALTTLESGDPGPAMRALDLLPRHSLDRQILAWLVARSGIGTISAGRVRTLAEALDAWPGLATMRDNAERALVRESPAPRAMLSAFEETTPRTLEGVLALTRAYLAVGRADDARALLVPYWREERIPPWEEEKILAEFGGLLDRDDHRHRMVRMLHIDRIGSAERVAELAGGKALTAAWAAVTRGEPDAGKLIAAVPEAGRGPAYRFVKTRYLRRAGKITAAAETMRQAPSEAAALVDPDAWWIERRVLSRELLDIGKPKAAYEIAASHAAASPVHAVDAEFHAGWYALRFLDAPETAVRRIVELSDGPISLARGHYWLARAHEATGEDEAARNHFMRAAEHQTAFYGQIAAARLSSVDTASLLPEIGTEDRRRFGARPAVHAIRRLEAIEAFDEADALYRALARELNDAGEIMLLAEMAGTRGDHRLALRVGKWAAARGLEVGAIAFPVGAIPETSDISAAGTALAYAIARQESEFNASARSPAGALGMLQLLPGTARDMARAIGVSYEPGRLTRDAAYNARLGAAYLGAQLERFDGSYILTFAGYNAGPRRAREWVERYGDPRGAALEDVIDWIERIPYHETRAYVQRVMENYQVYKMRLSDRMEIVEDLTQGRD